MPKNLSNLILLHLHKQCDRFCKNYKLMYQGENFLVYKYENRNCIDNVTIFKTSDKCIRLLRSRFAPKSNAIYYESFRGITAFTDYLNKNL